MPAMTVAARTTSVFKPVSGALLVLALSSLGCGDRAPSPHAQSSAEDGAALPDECMAYLASYEDCMRRLTPRAPEVANARAESARASLAQVTDRNQLKKTCTSAVTQLRGSCK